jgi:hypothetical protein
LRKSKKIKKASKATTATLPITIPAIGPPPNPFFEPLEAAVVDVVGAAKVEEAAVGVFVGAEVVSRPPSLVVVLSKTDTV